MTDVLAGYLFGAFWLWMCIFIYRWVSSSIAQPLHQQAAVSN